MMGQMELLELQHCVCRDTAHVSPLSHTTQRHWGRFPFGTSPTAEGSQPVLCHRCWEHLITHPRSHLTPPAARHQMPAARSPLPTGSPCCRSLTPHGIHPHTQNPTTWLGTTLPQLSNTNILCAFGSKHSSAGFPRPRAACVSLSPGCMPSPPDKRGQS